MWGRNDLCGRLIRSFHFVVVVVGAVVVGNSRLDRGIGKYLDFENRCTLLGRYYSVILVLEALLRGVFVMGRWWRVMMKGRLWVFGGGRMLDLGSLGPMGCGRMAFCHWVVEKDCSH